MNKTSNVAKNHRLIVCSDASIMKFPCNCFLFGSFSRAVAALLFYELARQLGAVTVHIPSCSPWYFAGVIGPFRAVKEGSSKALTTSFIKFIRN